MELSRLKLILSLQASIGKNLGTISNIQTKEISLHSWGEKYVGYW